MTKLYGTYLNFLVLQVVQTAAKPLSVREIAARVYTYDDEREQRNFEDRCRRAVRQLVWDEELTGKVLPSECQANLSITKYYVRKSHEPHQQGA